MAVEALTADAFTVTNGRTGTPVKAGDGLKWSVTVRADRAHTGLVRVRLNAARGRPAAERLFQTARLVGCSSIAQGELSALALEGLDLSPAFSAGTTAYTARVAVDKAQTTVTATPVCNGATVTVSPADADAGAPGHQVALHPGENRITVGVSVGTQGQDYTVNVSRALLLGAPTGFAATAGDGEVALSWSSPDNTGSHALVASMAYGGNGGFPSKRRRRSRGAALRKAVLLHRFPCVYGGLQSPRSAARPPGFAGQGAGGSRSDKGKPHGH